MATQQMSSDAKPDRSVALMSVNGLNYSANGTSLSVVSSRKYKTFSALNNSYKPGQVMKFILASGSEFMNGQNSFIKFKVKVTAVTAANNTASYPVSFGTGKGATNLFEEAVFTHSSGTEIERIENLNLLRAHMNHWEHDKDWFNTVGEVMGISEAGNLQGSGGDGPGTTLFSATRLGYPATTRWQTADRLLTISANGGAALPADKKFRAGDIIRINGNAANQDVTLAIEHSLTDADTTAAQTYTLVSGVTTNEIDYIGRDVYRTRAIKGVQDSTGFFENANKERTFCVPLSQFSNIFNQSGQLLPGYLVAGSRLELKLAPGALAFIAYNLQGGDSGPTSNIQYEITEPQIVMDLYTLVDNVLRTISAVSANTGLGIDWNSYWSSQSVQATNNATVNVSKALSLANSVHIITRSEAATNPGTNSICRDSFDTPLYWSNLNSYQVVLGSQFLPQQPVEDVANAYCQSQACWQVMDGSRRNNVDYYLKFGGLYQQDYPQGNDLQTLGTDLYSKNSIQTGMPSVFLERSSQLANSGQAVSAQRGLEVRMNFVDAGAKKINIFINYVKIVDVYVDQIMVRL